MDFNEVALNSAACTDERMTKDQRLLLRKQRACTRAGTVVGRITGSLYACVYVETNDRNISMII